MTREEAIYWIKNLAVLSTEKDMASITEALNMAIEALEQAPSDDCISRQAAIDALYDKGLSMTAWGELLAMKWSDIQTCIELLPSAQPFTAEQIQTMQELEAAQVEKAYELGKADRPTGHWIDDDEQQILMKKFIEKGENWKVCNICGAGMRVGAKYDTDEQYRDFFHNYCPYCGARMESGEE